MNAQPPLRPIVNSLAALHKAMIRFLIVGGTVAVLQGAPIATIDTDIWLKHAGSPIRLILTIGQRLQANILSGSVSGLRDDQRVDFLYRIDGLASFATEWKRAEKLI